MSHLLSHVEPNRANPAWDDTARKWLQEQLEIILAELNQRSRIAEIDITPHTTSGTIQETLWSYQFQYGVFKFPYKENRVVLTAYGVTNGSTDSKVLTLSIGGNDISLPDINSLNDEAWAIELSLVPIDDSNVSYAIKLTTQVTMEVIVNSVAHDVAALPLPLALKCQTDVAGELTLQHLVLEYNQGAG